MALWQIWGLGLLEGEAVIGQRVRWGLLDLCGPQQGLVILETEPHPHLHGEAAIFVDQDTLLDVVVQDGGAGLVLRVGVGAGTEAVGEGLLRGEGVTRRAVGRVGARVDDALLGLQTKVNYGITEMDERERGRETS